MANFASSLTGQQLNDALTQVEQRVPEGWAVGERAGIPVSSSSPYYHNNAKYYAENALDSANRAEAAVPAGTAGAVFFDRVQTLTDSQKAQARQNIQAGATNPNLLDNPWWGSWGCINQRGFSTVTDPAEQYTIDRWKIFKGTGTGGTVAVQSSNAILFNNSSGTAALYFRQLIGNDMDLTNKVVTLSIKLSDGTVYSGTGTIPAKTTSFQPVIAFSIGTGGDFGITVARTTDSNYRYIVQLNINAGVSYSVSAVKLELGSVSTLANDIAPNYAEELAKCQRYFVRLKSTLATAAPLVGDFAVSAGAIDFTIGLPQSLAKFPTITHAGVQAVTVTGTVASITSVSPMDIIANNLRLRAYGTFTQNTYYKLTISQSSYIDISAEL